MAVNVQFYDGDFSWAVYQALSSAAVGSKRTAGYNAIIQAIGSNPTLQAFRNGTLVLDITLNGSMSISSNQLLFPTTVGAVRTIGTADINTGTWLVRVCKANTPTTYMEGAAGPVGGTTPFKFSSSLAPTNTLAIGTVTMAFDAAIDSGGTSLTTSAAGTMVPPAAQIVDAASPLKNVWTRTAGKKILKNGAPPTNPDPSANVEALLWQPPYLFQTNTAGGWWKWDETAGTGPSDPNNWVMVPGDPRIPVSGYPTPPITVSQDVYLGSRTVPASIIGYTFFRFPTDRDGGGLTPAPSWTPGIVRLGMAPSGTEWYRIAANAGQSNWDWTYLDAAVNYWSSRGTQICYTLMWTPVRLRSLDCRSPISGNTYFNGTNSMPTDLNEVYNFARALMQRYNSGSVRKIHYWETWNEPFPDFRGYDTNAGIYSYWTGSVWPTNNSTADKNQRALDLFRLHRYAANGVRSIDPGVKLLTPGWSPGEGQSLFISATNRFCDTVIPEGGTNRALVDGLACHPYNNTNTAAHIYSSLADYVAMRDGAAPGKPLIVTEVGDQIQEATGVAQSAAYHIAQTGRRALLALGMGYDAIMGWGADEYTFTGAPSINNGAGSVGAFVANFNTNVVNKTLRRVSILTDGTVWAGFDGGTSARY